METLLSGFYFFPIRFSWDLTDMVSHQNKSGLLVFLIFLFILFNNSSKSQHGIQVVYNIIIIQSVFQDIA